MPIINIGEYKRHIELTYPLNNEDELDILDKSTSSLDDFSSDTNSEHDYSSSSSDIFEESGDVSRNVNEEQNFGFVNGGNQPRYEGADLTHNQSLLLLMSFVLRHQLTDEALNDFLSIMNMHLPNVVPESKYLFYKKFNHQAFTHHYFCGDCTFYFGPSNECGANKLCLCHVPNSVESAKLNKWYFSYWSLESQLKLLLQDDTIADCLLNRTENDHGDCLTDATDGILYKQLKEVHGYGPNNISLLWNANGVPVFWYVVFLFKLHTCSYMKYGVGLCFETKPCGWKMQTKQC